jgi:hypothetical protein
MLTSIGVHREEPYGTHRTLYRERPWYLIAGTRDITPELTFLRSSTTPSQGSWPDSRGWLATSFVLSRQSRLGYSLYLPGIGFLCSFSNFQVPMRSCGVAPATPHAGEHSNDVHGDNRTVIISVLYMTSSISQQNKSTKALQPRIP